MTAELWARSCYSLLQGASHPEELVETAASLGLRALAICDRDGVQGLPQAHKAAKEHGLRLVCGATITVVDQLPVVLLAETLEGWGSLCRLLTEGHHAAAKGRARVPLERVCAEPAGLTLLLPWSWDADAARPLRDAYGDHLEVALARTLGPPDAARTAAARHLSAALGRPIVATNDVLFHDADRRRVADVLTAIRRRTTLEEAGLALQVNGERRLLGPDELADRFADLPEAVARTDEVAARCTFSLDELHYVYPREVAGPDETPSETLRRLVREGCTERFPEGVPAAVAAQLEHELGVIEQLDFPPYFLTVHDVVREARARGILCQGRGSAANSAVCYVLGITSVDPSRAKLLFERFISVERAEPPDIDVDFEHERREELIQYLYDKYGRDRAAMVSEVITWRPRSAVRDAGKALGLSLDQVDRLAKLYSHWSSGLLDADRERLEEAGLDPDEPAVRWTLRIAGELCGLPRHLGIHSGGFVLSDTPLIDLVPVEPATMPGRTVCQWDKYAIEALGFIKVDVLALGMLTAIRKSFQLLEEHDGVTLALHTVPPEVPAVYDMFSRADTVGIFQIESRAQQSMLPRLRPACFYDLVVEVAIVRPGPIQGGMVHPYLRRRSGEEPVVYPHPDVEPILSRTLGVPIFQEQVMAMAMAVGGFSAGEADKLRRAMGAWRRRGTLDGLGQKLVDGMAARGMDPAFADAVLQQIKGFGEYGFPESHAASFALLVYVSGWIKAFYPEHFAAALVNSQPMGFYPPRTLLGDAGRHAVRQRPACVMASEWDCTLEPDPEGAEVRDGFGRTRRQHAIRLGLRLVDGLGRADAEALLAARARAPFKSLPDLARRSGLHKGALQALADANAFAALEPDRRQAAWTLQGLWTDLPLFAHLGRAEPRAPLPEETPLEALAADYRSVGLSLADHPAAAARRLLAGRGLQLPTLADLATRRSDSRVRVVGLVGSRQRPSTAKGVTFISLEDETGLANLVVWPKTWEAWRKLFQTARILGVDGTLQRQDGAWSVLVGRPWLVEDAPEIHAPTRDFR
jgi:error-prone DNA polymerase